MLQTERRPNDLAIAYVVSEYPATSHSFIRREVAALRARGLRIRPFSIRQARDLIAEADRQEATITVALRPISPAALLKRHLSAASYSPAAYLRTMRFALSRGRGARATLWQLFYFAEAMVLWSYCRKEHLQHLHSHFANSGSDVARLTAAFMKHAGRDCSWSFTMHGSAEFLDIKGFGLARKVEDADQVVCISDYCRSQLMWLVDVEHWTKLSVVRCGVAVQPRSLDRVDGQELSTLRILTVGRLLRLKGHALLIEAATLLQQRGIGVELRIVGDGPLRDRVSALASAPQTESQVTLLGAVGEENLEEQYQWADVFCLPSMMEGLPVVLMEAMARALPVVATQITAVGELVEDGDSGLLVRPGRSDLLADALERVARDPVLRKQLSKNAQERVQSEFDIAHSASLLEDIFRNLAAGRMEREHIPSESGDSVRAS